MTQPADKRLVTDARLAPYITRIAALETASSKLPIPIYYLSGAYAARSTATTVVGAVVNWIGPVQPTIGGAGMADGDFWTQVSVT